MSKKAMDELRDMLCRELDEISRRGSLSSGDLDTAQKLTDTIKNIDKIGMLEQGGYSSAYWGEGGSYHGGSYRGSYDDGGSRDGDGSSGRRYYSRAYSRDGDNQKVKEQLRDMMQSADGQAREAIRRAMEEIDRN